MSTDIPDQTARLGLPYLAAGQMQKHVTLNEALARLDMLVQCQALSRSVSVQPETPGDGALYILPPEAEGAYWSLFGPGQITRHEAGHWTAETAPEGMLVHLADEDRIVVRSLGDWRSLSTQFGELQSIDRLGLNTTADAENPVALKTPKVLMTAVEVAEGGDGDLRVTLNKQATADVGSLMFQTGYEGRAELGLTGSDDLTLKVSADGTDWTTAFSVSHTTGAVAFTRGATRLETTIFDIGGDYAVPVWAQRLEITCVGGGGGGGGGLAGTNGANRFGGGGGGAGGRVDASWETADLGTTITVALGAGGSGGASGAAGADGAASTLSVGGQIVLVAAGGVGGGAGTGTAGVAGQGGLGDSRGNGGGAAATNAWGAPGDHLACPRGPGGGGGGGGLNASNVARGGGSGGQGYAIGGPGGSVPGPDYAAVGAAGGAGGNATGAAARGGAGAGGAGGGAHASSNGGAGGAGGFPGGGGGGGGAARETAAGGPGGAGAAGRVRIRAIG